MANTIIAFINMSTIKYLSKRTTHNNPHHLIYQIVESIKQQYPNIRISSSLASEFKVFSTIITNNDNIILYKDQGPICMGKWATSTIKNTESYNESCHCLDFDELFNKLKTYSNKNRLQESKVSSGKPVEPKGNTIEVEGSGFAVEARSLRDGKVISC